MQESTTLSQKILVIAYFQSETNLSDLYSIVSIITYRFWQQAWITISYFGWPVGVRSSCNVFPIKVGPMSSSPSTILWLEPVLTSEPNVITPTWTLSGPIWYLFVSYKLYHYIQIVSTQSNELFQEKSQIFLRDELLLAE